jgi:flagellar motor switch protein FliN/FliY
MDAPIAPRIEEFAAELVSSQDEMSAALGPGAAKFAQTEIGSGPPRNLNAILHIPVQLRVVLGSASMPVAELFKLGRGAVVPLDRRVGDPVDIVVNGHIIARGEVVVMSDGGSRFGISLTEIVGSRSGDPQRPPQPGV